MDKDSKTKHAKYEQKSYGRTGNMDRNRTIIEREEEETCTAAVEEEEEARPELEQHFFRSCFCFGGELRKKNRENCER